MPVTFVVSTYICESHVVSNNQSGTLHQTASVQQTGPNGPGWLRASRRQAIGFRTPNQAPASLEVEDLTYLLSN